MSQAKEWVCFGLFRFLLPITLLAACVVRVNGFSLLYGCLMLLAPVMPRPTELTMRGSTGVFLAVTVGLSSLTLLAQIIFQSFLLIKSSVAHPYGSIPALKNCSSSEKSLRQLGLQRVEQDDIGNILRVVLPDILAFLISLVVLICCRVLLCRGSPSDSTLNSSPSNKHPSTIRRRILHHTNNVANILFSLFVIIFLALSGIAKPSLLSAVYLLMCFGICMWLALWKRFGRGYIKVEVGLMVYSAAHLILVYLYQFQFFQESVPPNLLVCRLIGLTPILKTDCRKPWLLDFHDVKWPVYVSPAMIVLLYLTLASEIRRRVTRTQEIEQARSRKPAHQPRAVGTERQVPGPDNAQESLVTADDDHHSYHAMDETPISPPYQDADAHSSVSGGMLSECNSQPDKVKKRSAIESIGVFVMRQSYVATLIIMMAWSITYHSWLTFVYLIWACIIWLIPSKRTVCLYCSPLIVVYAICLISLQYVWSLEIDLPQEVKSSKIKISDIGPRKFDYPCLPLGVQMLFSVMFWITLRQFIQERRQRQEDNVLNVLALQEVDPEQTLPKRRQSHESLSGDKKDGDAVKAVGRYTWHMFCKYWILVCTAMFLLMALQEAVIYRILYMVFFLYFIITFQVCYWWWRVSITIFWWVVIVYSMIVVSVVYTYQFEGTIPWGWLNDTNISAEMLADIGLEKFDTGTLFVKLLTPTAFLIIIIIQLHYFQRPFLELSDINRLRQAAVIGSVNTESPALSEEGGGANEEEAEPVASGSQEGEPLVPEKTKETTWRAKFVSAFSHAWRVFYGMLDTISALLWRLMEVHIVKAVMFTIFICCLAEVTAVNVVLVIFVLIGVTSPRLHVFMSYACCAWTGLIILAKMTYQLSFISITDSQTNCTTVENIPWSTNGSDLPFPFNQTINNALYVGFEKRSNLADYLKNYIIIILILALEGVIRVHQAQYWGHPDRTRPYHGIIFQDIRRADADKGLVEAAKFFVNYTFYKFGLQICYIMTMVTMVVRLDAFSVLYGIFLGVLLLLRRRGCYHVWPVYMLVLITLLILQYLSCLGVPPGLCWSYPWDYISSLSENLKIYLYLPNYVHRPYPYKLLADFFQFLFVCLQWWVFQMENSEDWERYGGGSNKSIMDEVNDDAPNPVADFLSYKDSYLDYLKAAVFQYSFWLTLIIVFIAGTSRISLFCLGYLVACFFFLWFGQELLVKPLKNLIRLWGVLLGYNYFVILAKSGLQLVGCVYRSNLEESFCWLIQLFSIMCLRSSNYNIPVMSDKACSLDEDEVGLIWDAITFVFLLIMLVIYKSHYFRHVVTEIKVQNSLAHRGADLINMSLIKRVAELKNRENDTLDSIKRKMERIKMRQAKLQEKALHESDDHYVVIRSGDYYMFDDVSDEDEMSSIDVIEREVEDKEDEDKVGPLEIIDAALKGGTKEALDVADRKRHSRHSESESDGERPSPHLRRRSSRVSDSHVIVPDTPDKPSQPEKSDKPDAELQLEVSGAEHDISEYEEVEGEESEKSDTCFRKMLNGLRLAWAIFCGFLDYLIVVLHNISREYRSVSRILDREKEQEKMRLREQRSKSETEEEEVGGGDEEGATDPQAPLAIRRRPTDLSLQIEKEEQDVEMLRNEQEIDAKKDAEKEFRRGMPRILQLTVAALEVLLSRSDVVCYFAMVLNVLVSASLLSLPYPLSVFLWALLSVPRPSKTYWVTIITYTEAVVVVKYLFQFGFFPWNDGTLHDDPFWPPRIIGIEKKSSYAVFDLILLFCLFVHRSVLKRYGLWKDLDDIEEDFAAAEQKVGSPATSPQEPGPLPITDSGQTGDDDDDLQLGADNTTFQKSESTQGDDDDDGDQKKERKHKKKRKGLVASIFAPFINFYHQMTNTKYNAVTDVYATMFLCDFVTFLIVVFGYWAFGPAETAGGETVTNVLQENKVPPLFLAMLLVQFILIIIDRGIYLRKQVFAKFLFQIFLVILVHVWMFFILPAVTQRSFTDNLPAQLWYFTKSIYFGLSAYQIRSAYPTRILGNFLTKKFNYLNLFLFKGFLAIPFLLELRALMDWMWTDTTLALTSWLTMEDIYANIFVLKCWRRAETEYPTPRGNKRKALVKYGVGGLLLFVLAFIIWFPLLLFSLSASIFQPNPPVDCTVEMRFGGFQPIFRMSAQQLNIDKISDTDLDNLKSFYSSNPAGAAFLSGYQQTDIYKANINGFSTATWGISPPSEISLQNSLMQDPFVNLFVSISFTREPSSSTASDTVSNQFVRTLNRSVKEDEAMMNNLTRMLIGNETTATVTRVFPPYITVPGSRKPEASRALLTGEPYTTVNFNLSRQSSSVAWWELRSKPPAALQSSQMSTNLTIISFNDRIAPSAFTFFTSYGVIGLYISVVIVIGQFVRIFFSGTSNKIMYEQLPCVERIYRLCMDIYLVRESHDYMLEEDLFSKLIFLYRSPETMIKFTKIKAS